MNKIIYKITNGKPGFWLMRDDRDSSYNDYPGGKSAYDHDFERVKANALEIINPELLFTEVPLLDTITYKDGDTFDLEGLEFVCAQTTCVLIPKTETQDELWKEAIEIIHGGSTPNWEDTLKSKFTIKRNPTP